MKKKKKRKKLKLKSILIVLIGILLLVIIFFLLAQIKIKSYFIYDNKYLTDEEVLNELKLDSDSSFLLTNSLFKGNIVKDSKLIKSVDFDRNLNFELKIHVTEYKMLYTDSADNKVVLENGNKVDYQNKDLPVLINKIEDKDVLKQFIKKLAKVDYEVLGMISEISYSPNGIDKERFLFSMNDGNYVYITLTKMTKINDYKKIIDSVEDKKGILYLDYGNYFVPKE